MSISAKLTELNNIKEDIKAALEYKGLTVSNQFNTYAEQIRSLGNADGSEDPFATIGYYKFEQMPWLNKQLEQSQNVIDNWNPENTKLTGTNIYFYPLIDTQKVTDMSSAFKNMTTLRSIALLDTLRVTTMSNMFQGCTNLITIPEFNTPQLTDTSYMFDGCTLLENIPAIKTDKVTNMSYMFQNCKALKEIPLFNTNSVTNMSYMFNGCTSLTTAPIHAYNTSKVTNMQYMFNGCTTLKELSFVGCDLSKVTTWSNIVTGCSALTKVDFTNCKVGNGFQLYTFGGNKVIYDNLDTSAMTDTSYLFRTATYNNNVDVSNMNFSNVTDMSYMFQSCQSNSIIVGNVDTSKVTNMSFMFDGCNKVADLDLSGIDVSKVTTMAYMFNSCSVLTNLNLSGWNTDSLTNMQYMFQNCQVLDTLDLSMFNTSKVTSMSYLFYNCKTNSLILDGWDFSSLSSNTSWLTDQSSKNVSLKNVKAKGAFTCPYASESIDLTGIDTTSCTSFKVTNCLAPIIDVSYVNTSNFTSMSSMFSGCSNISSLNISHFDYSKVTNMQEMFYNCSKLESITMGGRNQVTNMSSMFSGCTSLTKIDLTNLQLDLVTNMDYMFYGCTSLTEVIMGGNPAKITSSSYVEYMFNNITTNGIFYYNAEYDYSKIIAKLPSTWKAVPLVNPTECTSLTIEADNVTSDKTSTTIRYTAIVNGTNPINGAAITGIELTGTAESSEFEQNLTESDITRTISYTYLGVTATTTITQYQKTTYTVTLAGSWQESDVNPDATLYNAYKASGSTDATLTINLSKGCTELSLKGLFISGYNNYLRFRELDSTSTSLKNISYSPSSTDTSDISNYTDVVYTDIDPNVEHTITILADYYSTSYNAYVLIPKQ